MPLKKLFIRVFLRKWLLSHEITRVGTLKSNRRGILSELKMQLSENCIRIYAFKKKSKEKTDSCKKKTDTKKKTKSVIHKLHDYFIKGGTDVMDQRIGTYTCGQSLCTG